jgi:hypothetical protein
MNIICAGNGSEQYVTKNAILKNIKKYKVYYCKSYAQSKLKDPPSKEQREKISKTLKGRRLSEETKIKISEFSKKNNSIKYVKGKTYYETGMPHPNLGKKQDPKTTEKISLSNTGKIRTLKMREKYSESRKKLMKKQGGLTKETKEKISKIVANKIQSGEFNPFGNCKKIRHTSNKCKNTYNTIKLKSSYEKVACILLDNDYNCISYEYEPLQIQYTDSQENNKIYIPDFIVKYNNKEIKILEIKPLKLMKIIPNNLIKQKACIEYCKKHGYIYEFWNEKTMNIENQAYIQYDESLYDTYEEFKIAVKNLAK